MFDTIFALVIIAFCVAGAAFWLVTLALAVIRLGIWSRRGRRY